MNGEWITDWSLIDDDARYIMAPINARASDGVLYLGWPVHFSEGWRVKTLRQGCYAALPCPPFPPGFVGGKL